MTDSRDRKRTPEGGSDQGCTDSEAGMGGQMGFGGPCFVPSRYRDPNPLPLYTPVFWKLGCEGGEVCGDHTIHPSLAPVWATPTLRT